MARPNKAGLDYFPFDVTFHDDDKIALLTAEFNVIAEAIIIRLLCKIYKNGYYYAWGEDERLLFCRWAGGIFVPNQVDEVVKGCLRRSFFDKGVFEAFGILTSSGIQKRFLQACQERKSIDIIADYWLLDIPSDDRFNIIRVKNEVNRPINEVNRPRNSQRKEKNISTTTTTTARDESDYPKPSVNDFSDTPQKGSAEKVPPVQATHGVASCVPIKELPDYMKSNTVWFEALCMNNHLDPEYVKRKIDEFGRFCEDNGEMEKDRQDCFRHFNNWLRKVQQQPKPKTAPASRPTTASRHPATMFCNDKHYDDF